MEELESFSHCSSPLVFVLQFVSEVAVCFDQFTKKPDAYLVLMLSPERRREIRVASVVATYMSAYHINHFITADDKQ